MNRSTSRFQPGPARKTLAVGICATLATLTLSTGASAQWTQWGGPSRNFIVETDGLADEWPEEGPTQLWSRELGDGYSSILADEGHLYTMYRNGTKEVVVALDASNGKTLWEMDYEAPLKPGHLSRFGEGPRSTPLIQGDRLFTVGVTGVFHCLDKRTGKVFWSHMLWDDFECTFLNHGYSSSPFAYKDKVIMLTGGDGNSMISFNQKDGSIAWKKNDFKNSYSTPRLIDVDGLSQLLCYMGESLVSIDPENGNVFWTYDIQNQWGQNISQPVYDERDGVLLVSSAQAGSRGLKLTREGKTCKAEEVWTSNRVQFYYVNTIGLDEWVYGSSGGPGGASFFSCINRKTGEIGFRIRGLSKAHTLFADDKFIILDEDGRLALAKGNEEEFEIVSKAKVLEKVAWTAPTLAGTTLYVRDKNVIIALDLS